MSCLFNWTASIPEIIRSHRVKDRSSRGAVLDALQRNHVAPKLEGPGTVW